MVDRHVVTKQRMPSIKSVIKGIEAELEKENTPEGKAQLERALDYWKRRKKKCQAFDTVSKSALKRMQKRITYLESVLIKHRIEY